MGKRSGARRVYPTPLPHRPHTPAHAPQTDGHPSKGDCEGKGETGEGRGVHTKEPTTQGPVRPPPVKGEGSSGLSRGTNGSKGDEKIPRIKMRRHQGTVRGTDSPRSLTPKTSRPPKRPSPPEGRAGWCNGKTEGWARGGRDHRSEPWGIPPPKKKHRRGLGCPISWSRPCATPLETRPEWLNDGRIE